MAVDTVDIVAAGTDIVTVPVVVAADIVAAVVVPVVAAADIVAAVVVPVVVAAVVVVPVVAAAVVAAAVVAAIVPLPVVCKYRFLLPLVSSHISYKILPCVFPPRCKICYQSKFLN